MNDPRADVLLDTVRWCIARCLDPMIKNKLQAAIDNYESAAGEADPLTNTTHEFMTIKDLVRAAGPDHFDARIKLQIIGGKETAYGYIPNRFASIMRSEDVVVELKLAKHTLHRKKGTRP